MARSERIQTRSSSLVYRERDRGQVGDGLVEGLVAAQRGAADDAAGVEADQVEAGPDLVGVEERAGALDELDPGAARPAGVEEQRPDPAAGVGGREPGQGQGDLLALGPVVVQRHHRGGALEGLQALARAGRPVQPGDGRGPGARRGRRAGAGRRDGEQRRRQHGHQGREHGPAEPVPCVRGLCQDWTPLGHAPAAPDGTGDRPDATWFPRFGIKTRVGESGVRTRPTADAFCAGHIGENGAKWGLTETGRSGRVRSDGTVASSMPPCC